MRDEEAPPAARLGAANAILDRAHGRPPQAIALRAAGDNYDFDRLTDEQLLLLEELLTIALVSGPYEPAVVEGELLPAP